MEDNLLLVQYSWYKKIALEESPYKCLLNTEIVINPHQINAFCAAIKSLKTGGIILADEVGLGKTIEAGLVIKYVLGNYAKKIIIAVPAALRKQWEIELDEKFNLKARILDRSTVKKEYYSLRKWIEADAVRIVLTSYDYASKFMKIFPLVKWDLVVVDEAHNLRNVFHGRKRAKNLYEITKGIPKILLTATPLQNSLSDLHGLVSFIDPRIFGSEKAFNKRFVEGQDYSELKKELFPVLYRTLRRDVDKYMDFKKRICKTVDFHLTAEENELYNLVNSFLKKENLYSIPTTNRKLIILIIRKLLASSSQALVKTMEVLKNRLEKLYQGTKSSEAVDGFNLFWYFVQDEIDESDFEDNDEENIELKKKMIQEELDAVLKIIETANRVNTNAKIVALKIVLSTAFQYQEANSIPQKVVVFTESKRTQKYIADELRKDGYHEEDIVLFNGDFDDAMTEEIYRVWQVKNYGNENHGRSVEYKHAIVDYFKNHAKILIVTDAGSEGLNLQFCNTIINYDLPWNPQKIEQRIGRCHRYGQMYDVVAINFLNTDNEADKRIYEILSRKFKLFDGVFGASDVALGTLESGLSFEEMVLDIYQKCNTIKDFNVAFNKLSEQLDKSTNAQVTQLQNILITESAEAKGKALEKTKDEITQYKKDVEYWAHFQKPEKNGKTYFAKIDNWGEETFGGHGLLFLGAFCNNNTKLLFPVLLLCDENGEYIDFEERDLVKCIGAVDDKDISFYKPSDKEIQYIIKIHSRLTNEMLEQYKKSVAPIIAYNRTKVENWIKIQTEQLKFQIIEMNEEIKKLFIKETEAKSTLEKQDIRKKIIEKKHKTDMVERTLPDKENAFEKEAKREIEKFEKQFEINPVLLINIVLKF